MKSRTLSSDLTILRKDLTRFAPVWLLLSLWLVLWGYDMAMTEANYRNSYEPIAVVFAPISALVLFGYLTKPRECVAVHALPIRRERLFALHVLAGFVMFAAPTAVFCVLTDFYVKQHFLYRLAWTVLEFGFLFSIGIFCMMLTGTKLGAGLLYCFIQIVTVIFGNILQVLYVSQLPGVYLENDYMLISPSSVIGSYADFIYDTQMDAEAWITFAFFAVLTVVLLAISLILYRRRKLEHAGDLLAVTWLNPFFAVCSGLTGASVLNLFFTLDDLSWPMVLIGLAAGYLAYWMLSKRSARVFTPKILAGLACLMVVVLGSVYITGLDPFDRVSYTPDPEEVVSAEISEGSYDYYGYTTSDPPQIAALEELQLKMLDAHVPESGPASTFTIHFTYELENGRTIQREYEVADGQLLEQASWYLSQPIALFQKEDPTFFQIDARKDGTTYTTAYITGADRAEFHEIFIEDCRQGNRHAFGYQNDSDWSVIFSEDRYGDHYVSVPIKAKDTIAWLEEHSSGSK